MKHLRSSKSQTSLQDHESLRNNGTDINPDLQQLRWVVYEVVFPVLVTIGVLANLLNLLVLSRPPMKGAFYRYLNHLAISDLLYLTLNIPFCLKEFAQVSHQHSVSRASAIYYAYIGIPVVNFFLSMSEYIVVWLSYDRCLAVCNPQKFTAKQRLRVVRIRTVTTFFFTIFVYSLSPLRQTYHCEGSKCFVVDNAIIEKAWYKGYESIREVYSRFLPAIVITVYNAAIIVKLKHMKKARGGPDVITEARQERERRLICLLLAITVFFYISAFPSAIYKILMFSDKFHFIPYFRAVADMLEVSGHVFNFFLYFLFCSDYRKVLVSFMSNQQPNTFVSSSAGNL